MHHYIYQITNLINGKIYVGKHSTENLDDGYMGSGKLLNHAINKHGIENFRKHIVTMCETSEEAFDVERQIVNEQFVAAENTYNLTVGGNGFEIGSNLASEAGRAAAKTNLANPEWHKKFSIVAVKKRESNEARSVRQRKAYVDGKFRPPTFEGRKHTDQAKSAIGNANSVSQSGERNSQFGTVWIFNEDLKQSRKVRRDGSLDQLLINGWKLGRKIKFE